MNPLVTFLEAVDELTKPRTNKEPYSYVDANHTVVHQKHETHVPPLLEQLQQALEPGGTGEAGRAVPASRPSARVDAMDTYRRIDVAVYNWCKTYAEERRWDTLNDRLRALVGVFDRIENDEQHQLAAESRRWVTAAKVTTGWEVPARQLDNTCLACGARGGLRVRVGDGVTSADAYAVCVAAECGATWDNDTIGLLAEHIRAENNDEPLWEAS